MKDLFTRASLNVWRRRHSYEDPAPNSRGLVMMEIDGLSYHHLKKALADGRMPRAAENDG